MAKYKPTSKDELLGDIESEFSAITKELEEHAKDGKGGGKLPFKVPILTKSSDKLGHKAQIRFSVPQWMAGYASSLMSSYPQAKSPTDMQRACFYAGIKMLYYIIQEKADKNVVFWNTFAEQIEDELFDMEKIEHIKEFIIFLYKKYKKDVITLKQYKKRRNELIESLGSVVKTPIGKGALSVFKSKIVGDDDLKEISESTKEFL